MRPFSLSKFIFQIIVFNRLQAANYEDYSVFWIRNYSISYLYFWYLPLKYIHTTAKNLNTAFTQNYTLSFLSQIMR